MIYEDFAYIPFMHKAKSRLRQIYAVIYYLNNGENLTESIKNATLKFSNIHDSRQSVEQKIGRQFAGTNANFFKLYKNGLLLDELIRKQKLNEHDKNIFSELIQMTSTVDIDDVIKQDLDSLHQEEEKLTEGGTTFRFSNHYERNPVIRKKTIDIHGTSCQVCGFNFEEFYGKHGANFIEVHHLKPICNIEEGERINPSIDMAVLCSNCHRMIHRNRRKILSLDELSNIIKKLIGENKL